MEGINVNSTDYPVNITSSNGVRNGDTRVFYPGQSGLVLPEIHEEYIKDYAEYKSVLEGCESTLMTETPPQDGE